MSTNFSFVSNPFTHKGSNEKIEKLKQEQEARRAGLREEMLTYQSAFDEQQEVYIEAKKEFELQQFKMACVYDETDKDYQENKDIFTQAKKNYFAQRSKRDLKLSLLQFHSDNYNKASRLNLIDLA